MASHSAQQYQQYVLKLVEECNLNPLQEKNTVIFFRTAFGFFPLTWCHKYLLLSFDDVFDLQQMQKGENSRFLFPLEENSYLKYTKLQQYKHGNNNIDTFGVAAPDGTVC